MAGSFEGALSAWRTPEESKGMPPHQQSESLLARVGVGAMALHDIEGESTSDRGVRGARAANGLVFRLLFIWAAVIAAMGAIARLKPAINVTAIVPACENLPSGSALKPGDVIRAMDGKTIEVVNTDAEGRLVLADALCYARKLGCQRLVDAATLTGACVVALGSVRSGAFTNDQGWMDRVRAIAEAVGEKIWQMPMDGEYDEQITSDVADIKNIGGRKAGAVTAAKFLARFVGETPWIHLDIAGTTQADKEKGYTPKGATGVPVRTLIQLALDLAKDSD
ncbi:MAG: hypothetical protein IH782_09320 [candidate division NC10 bacterium]|nr:hypothetical protein [candidate division NC10 bacterium]